MFRIVALFLSFIFVVGIFPASALYTGKDNTLSESAVLNRASRFIETYMATDSQGKGRGIHTTQTLIPLYSLDDAIVAYMIPLQDKFNDEVGYMITSSYLNGSAMCELVVDSTYATTLLDCKNSSRQLYYFDLGVFALKNPEDNTFYIIDSQKKIPTEEIRSGEFCQLQENLFAEQTDISNLSIEKIYSFTNAVQGNHLFATENAMSQSRTITNYDIVDQNFWSLCEGYYGGDQTWLGSYSSTTCGQVCAANILAYEAMYSGLTSLYLPNTHSQQDYLSHMQDVVSFFGFLPTATTAIFSSSLTQFCANRSCFNLNELDHIYGNTPAGNKYYIQLGMAGGNPIAYLQWNGYYTAYDLHWMTITKYYSDGAGGEWIAVSTWGERRSLDLNLILNNMDGGGFVYFVTGPQVG